jgi:formylglycine-generating enzyme required for sulfatase activity
LSTFISYSRADSGFALRLAKDLRSAGYDVWLDQLDIPTGARWDDAIEIALETCTTFMIILSPASMQSQNVKDEIGFAIDAGKNILPLKLKPGDIPLRLRRFQYVDFSGQSYEKSLNEIKSILPKREYILTTRQIERRLIGLESPPTTGESGPAKPAPVPQPNTPRVPGPVAANSRTRRKLVSKSLWFGMVAIVGLAAAGITMNAIRTKQSPPAAPTSLSTIESSPTEKPTLPPTVANTQGAVTQATQSEMLTTRLTKTSDLNNWEQLIKGTGRASKLTVSPTNDGLLFDLNDPDLRAYYFYKPDVPGNVAIRLKAENVGKSAFNVGIICRRTGNTWYEFRISGDGLWYLYKYNDSYLNLANGGSLAIKTGKSINEYEMLCNDNQISLRINGETVKTYDFKASFYAQGQVGFSILSGKAVFPIDIKVSEYAVTEPSSGSAAPGSTSTAVNASDGASGSEKTFVSAKDGMTLVFVPEGEFTIGSDNGEANEKPAHTVFLNSFWIDRTQVTNAMFATFLNAKNAPENLVSTWIDIGDNDIQVHYGGDSWQADPGQEDFPLIEVKWPGASAYCEWRGNGTRLPTEAEWEKAARGTTDNLYAWGNQINCSLANYGTCNKDSVKVGTYPSNVSPFGALDMTGNVLEWVADWYGENYYQSSPSSNPTGPASGEKRVLRGGSWDGKTEYQVRSTFRYKEAPDASKNDAGFRCALPE